MGDLQYASPATVSRCGMVFVDPKNLGYEPFWQRWLESRESKNERDTLAAVYKKFVPGAIELILEGSMDGRPGEKLKTNLPITSMNMVAQLCYMLDSLLVKELFDAAAIEATFVMALYWSLGATLAEESREKCAPLLSTCTTIYKPR